MLMLDDLKTSQLNALVVDLSEGRGIKEFIDSVRTFLVSCQPRDLSHQDFVYSTGKRLANRNIWALVPALTLGSHLQDLDADLVDTLLDDADDGYRATVLLGTLQTQRLHS